MNNTFPLGTRIFFHGTDGSIKYGTVTSINISSDETQTATVLLDDGGEINLPTITLRQV